MSGGLSAACAVHCLATPLMLTLPGALGAVLGNEAFHRWILTVALPMSVVAIFLGCRQHRRPHVIALAVLGLGAMLAAVLIGHEVLTDRGERVLTLVGAGVLMISHWRNARLCRSERVCGCSPDGVPSNSAQ